MSTRSAIPYQTQRCLIKPYLRACSVRPISGTTQHPVQCRQSVARGFHTTRATWESDHYATLEIKPTASLKDIKRSYYKLSKTWHPDHNPDNQAEASKKFVAVSDAYHVLGDEKKRHEYDREHAPQASASSGSYSSAGGGSGFSAGGRKASGLSRRRGTFRGPPPSFYRQGGWGDAEDTRRANAGAYPREAEAKRRAYAQQSSTSGPYSGTTGSWPFTTDPNDVGHFDREGHFRTQSSVDEQLRKGRRKRRGVFVSPDDMIEDDGGGTGFLRFSQICGVLGIGTSIAFMVLGR